MVSVSGNELSDQEFQLLLGCAPASSILLIEDIDVLFPDRDIKDEDEGDEDRVPRGPTTVSMSGLLNAIDGVTAQHGRLMFMTTNYPAKLDSAILRPGRVDVRFELGYATPYQMKHMFLKFFPGVCVYPLRQPLL